MPTLPCETTGFGRRPALIVVDATLGFTDAASPLGCETHAERVAIAQLLAAFRARQLPIVYTVNAYANASEASVFRAKLPLLDLLTLDSPLGAFSPDIAPHAGETVMRKTVPSAFFDSPLREQLVGLGVDSVVVCGFSTSGCVRATAVDALQSNFRLVVVAEACGDRDSAAHEANLRDIRLKYGDVLTLQSCLQALDELAG